MTLQEVLQVIGGVGVISSFVYAALQIRRNALAVRAATYQQLNQSLATVWDDLAKNGELCDLVLRAGDDFMSLNRVERARFRFSLMGYLRRYQMAFFQHQVGVLREGDWSVFGTDMEMLFSLDGVRSAWPLIKTRSNPEFRAYIDALIARVPAGGGEGQPVG